MLPVWLTPPPLIDTACGSGDGFNIVMVTVPAFALRLLVLNLSWLGSALIFSAEPPPAGAAVVDELVLVLVDELLFLDEPQPATVSATIATKIGVHRVMRRTLPRSAEEELQQRLLRVKAILGLIPDRGALAVEHVGADLLARVGGQAVERDGVVARLREQ